ncbi:hypothetical protein CN378_01840 [Bacillus sp. AFS015802]|uniref:DUF2515 family protein n=1 Tax=Bacillus sp. AFS015802 TaxID=2033486 RepID=UPI000BF28796|nr:DUF2515 family protein [Bacillus sp. AFS015802]PFA70071.1 hypothetical protein CN378_01840 [Bacillus sp. AFS015802]
MKKISNTYRFLPYIPEPKRRNEWINDVNQLVKRYNADNVSRTNAYQAFFLLHPEIKWSFLAAMVSRNAGWNMTDLKGDIFSKLLSPETCEILFMTYERANWSIFQDAFPQLLLYHYSTIYKKKMFHLFKDFHISSFMEEEWNRFWEEGDERRLAQSLIINEQHLIQGPVIEQDLYKRKVFGTVLFFIEDHLHFSSVLFPTLHGELYGASVHGFRDVGNRIKLGNTLFEILFHPEYHRFFLEYAQNVEHTGSRSDYETYCRSVQGTRTPILQQAYDVITHDWNDHRDWSLDSKIQEEWYTKQDLPGDVIMTDWFFNKQRQLEKLAAVKETVKGIWPGGRKKKGRTF